MTLRPPIGQTDLKTEGTSRTFGQFVVLDPRSNVEQTVQIQPESSIMSIVTEAQDSTSISTVRPPATTSVVITREPSIEAAVNIIDPKQETTRNVFADSSNTEEPIRKDIFIEPETKTQIILAAANSNKDSTVVIPDKSGVDNSPINTEGNTEGEKIKEVVSVLGSVTLSKEQILNVLTEAQKVDLSITLKSKDSVPVEFNSLQVPKNNEANFIYHHWEKNETNIDIQEDPSKDPLLTKKLRDVSMYVELRWQSINVVQQVTENDIPKDRETQNLKDVVLRTPRGVGNAGNSSTSRPVGNFLKNLNLLKRETFRGKIVDIHEPERGFDSIANKRQFANSIHSTVSTVRNQFDQRSLFSLINKTSK